MGTLCSMGSEIMKILLVFDQYGWCFESECEGMKKYSKYDCETKRFDKVTDRDFLDYDLVYFSSPSLYLRFNPKKRTSKVLLGVASIRDIMRIRNNFDALNGVSKQIAFVLKKLFPNMPVYNVPDGVDHEIFKPLNIPHNFTVGWAGNYNRLEKRTHLLKSINFPVKIKSDRIFKKDLSKKSMVDFYNNIDVCVLTSISEGCSLVPMEASACKCAFVSTDTGTIKELIGEHWIIPVLSEERSIKIMNERLWELYNNPKLLEEVKERNYMKFMSEWTWKVIVKKHERMWEEICN